MSPLLKIEEPPAGDPTAPSWHAFLELGFRPLYLAGASWAMIAIVIWIFFPQWLTGRLQGVMWHGHEMLWGFIVTVAVGFLMTAGANWTGMNPLPQRALGTVCLLWGGARLAYLLPGDVAFLVAALCEIGFLMGAAAAMTIAVIRSRNYRNVGVPLVLMGLAVADVLLLAAVRSGNDALGLRYFHMGLMLMAMLVLLIGRRVVPFFAMRAVFGLDIPQHKRSGQVQLVLAMAVILGLILKNVAMTALALAAIGFISIWQVLGWKPWAVRSRPILWILYLGYGVTGLGLLVAAGSHLDPSLRGAWSVHTIAMGGFTVLIIGMMTRTALGHLGRPLELSGMMLVTYGLVIGATVFRLAALLASPVMDIALITAAVMWMSAFALYIWEFFPMMIRPRPLPRTARGTISTSPNSHTA